MHVAPPLPPAAAKKINVDSFVFEFESRREIEDDMMSVLKDESVKIIGVCGMGGVGKTTMAKKIMDRVRRDNLFDEVVMAVVSQPLDLSNIQLQIMEQLGLDFKQYETTQAKAHQIRSRLTCTKRILVILDDVWERIELEDVGISFGTKCRIFLTTRNYHVLRRMDAKAYEMRSMPHDEAWDLFKIVVGNSFNDDSNLHSLAEKVVKECKGLPLALTTIGRTLKNESDTRSWHDALFQLRSANPIDMPDVLNDVYKPLKLSYDRLESENAKSLFRLCGVFPEDYDISLEDLTRYSLGLNMIKGGGIFLTLEGLRHRVFTLVGTLKSRSLVQEGKDENHVKMHDLIRDVAIFIAKTEASPGIDWAAWVSVIPCEAISSTLCFLAMQNIEEHKLSENEWNNFFNGARDLNVLCLESISMRSLPQTAKLLKNLHTLHLIGCMNVTSISVFGELTSLEIVSLKYCNLLSKLPLEISRLNRLRLFEVYRCKSLCIIEPGVVSSLVLLEELKMEDSFKAWEAEEDIKKRRNACLKELESLTRLSCLEVEIEDGNLAAIQMALPPNIIKYRIEIGSKLIYHDRDYSKIVSLNLPGHIVLGKWIQKLLERAEFIELAGDSASETLEYFLGSAYLKRLGIYRCRTMRTLATTVSPIKGGSFFPALEYLTLSDLPNLETICDSPIPTASNFLRNLKGLRLESLPRLSQLWPIAPNPNLSLTNLSSIEVKRCYSLENLFQLSFASLHLESIAIEYCKEMREVFSTEMLLEDGRKKRHLAFPKLKNLKIEGLLNLTTFCKGAESIEFDRLVLTEIGDLPKLKSLIPLENSFNSRAHDQDSFHFFCNCKVAFGSLRELWILGVDQTIMNLWCRQIPPVHYGLFHKLEKLDIYYCHGIKDLFASPVMVSNLVNLKWLDISDCSEMVQVVGDVEEKLILLAEENTITITTAPSNNSDDGSVVPHHNHHRMFPKLEYLYLSSLPKLERVIGRWKCCTDGDDAGITIELPSLLNLDIYQCGRMEHFTVQGISLTTPCLQYIKIDKNNITDTKDVNVAIEQHYNLGEPTANVRAIDEEVGRNRTLKVDSILVSKYCDFVLGKDGVKVPISNLVGKNILLYFGGWWKYHWCRDFLPKLIEVYQEINGKGEALEVIFISRDTDQASFDHFFSGMPWLAIPLCDDRIQSLSRFFEIRLLPAVVAIRPTGEMVTTEARGLIERYGPEAYPFTAERIEEIETEKEKMAEGCPKKLKHQLHQHELLLTRRRFYICDGCDKKGCVWSYYCQECDFDLHQECASNKDATSQ